jgi:hypothetical protein
MNLRRWIVVPAATAMFAALMIGACSESRPLAPNPHALDGLWVSVGLDSIADWTLTISNDSVDGRGTVSRGAQLVGDVGILGALGNEALHATFMTVQLEYPGPFLGDANIEDEGEVDLTAESPTDLVGTMRGWHGSTPVHFRKLASRPTFQPPNGTWTSDTTLGMRMTLTWSNRDSVRGTGSYAAAFAGTRCGTPATLRSGSVRLTAIRPGPDDYYSGNLRGTLTLSDSIQYLFRAAILDSTRLVAFIESPDSASKFNARGCGIVLRNEAGLPYDSAPATRG